MFGVVVGITKFRLVNNLHYALQEEKFTKSGVHRRFVNLVTIFEYQRQQRHRYFKHPVNNHNHNNNNNNNNNNIDLAKPKSGTPHFAFMLIGP